MAETLHQMAERMCQSVEDCADCPLIKYNRAHEDNDVICVMADYDDVEEQIAKLLLWAKENPLKDENEDADE